MNGIEISETGADGKVVTTTPAAVIPETKPEGKAEKGKGTGSGRRKGSYSFAHVSLKTLVGKFAPGVNASDIPNVRIKAGRVWLEENDITEAVSAPANMTETKVATAVEEIAPAPVQVELS